MSIEQIQKQHAIRPGEIVFEIDNEHLIVKETPVTDGFDPLNPMKLKTDRQEIVCGNSHEHFPPVPTRGQHGRDVNFVRTRQVLMREGPGIRYSMDQALQMIEYIPGERIHIDMVNKIGRITDAIFDPENDSICNKLMNAAKSMQRSMKFTLWPSEYVEVDLSMSETSFWNWIFWMRKIADGDVEHGSGPPRHRGCALSGPRRCRPVQNIEQLPTLEECAKSLKVKLQMEWLGSEKNAEHFESRLRQEGGENYVPTYGNHVTLTPQMIGVK